MKKNYQNLWFQQRQSALSQLPYGQEECRTVREASPSYTIWRHGNSPDKFTSQSPECILPIFHFTGNLDISVFTLTSEEKPGFMVLRWESSQTSPQTSSAMPIWHCKTEGKEQIKAVYPTFHPRAAPTSLHGMMATSRWRQHASWAQQPPCTFLQNDGKSWSVWMLWTVHGLTPASLCL